MPTACLSLWKSWVYKEKYKKYAQRDCNIHKIEAYK